MENKIIPFDVNQTRFPDEQSKKIWFIGKNIVPREISLADIYDEEMRKGCEQIYILIHEMLWDMYNKRALYSSQNIDLLFNRFIKYGAQIDDSGYNWVIPCDIFKKYTQRFDSFDTVFNDFGFETSEQNGKILLSNKKYPLFLKYWHPLFILSQKRGVSVMSCDFRLFGNKYKLTIDDFLSTQSDKDKVMFRELHEYATNKGAKINTHSQYRRYRYIYKNENVLLFETIPSVTVPYNNQYSQKRDQWVSFDLFMLETGKQEDKDKLIKYIQDNIFICNACKDRKAGPKTKDECCGRMLDIYGKKRLAASCHPEIVKYLTADETQESIDYNLKMLKRMINIRMTQIDNY